MGEKRERWIGKYLCSVTAYNLILCFVQKISTRICFSRKKKKSSKPGNKKCQFLLLQRCTGLEKCRFEGCLKSECI